MKLKPYQRTRVVARYQAGEEQVREIAREYEVSERTIARVVAKAGLSYRRQRRPFTAEEKAEVVRLYKSGMATPLLATRFRCNSATVRKWLRAAGVKLRWGWTGKKHPWRSR